MRVIRKFKKNEFLIQIIFSICMLCYYINFSTKKSIWFDESVTRLAAKNSVEKIFSNFTNGFDSYHALYYLIVHYLALPFNHSLFSIRLISIISVVATMFGIVILCKKILTIEIGLISALFFSLSPEVLDYATEARSPGLVMAAVIWSLIFLTSYYSNSQSPRNLYFFTSIIIFNCYLSLFTILYWPLYFIFFYFKANKQIRVRHYFLSLLIVMVSIFPLIYESVRGSVRTDWIARDYKTITSVQHFIGLAFKESQFYSFKYVPVFLLIFWGVLILNLGRTLTSMRRKVSNQILIFLVFWGIVPGIILIIISLLRPMYLNRYLVACIPGLMILFVVSIQAFSREITKWGIITLITMVSLFQGLTPSSDQVSKDHWAKVKFTVQLTAKPHDSILMDSSTYMFFVDAVADPTFKFGLLQVGPSYLDGIVAPPKNVKNLNSAENRVWVISKGEVSTQVRKALLASRYRRSSVFTSESGEKFWLYEKTLA